MKNMKSELLDSLEGLAPVKCASLRLVDYFGTPERREYALSVDHTEEDLKEFLSDIDFRYSEGEQELFGTVWLEDGTWLDRMSDSTMCWWEYHKYPEVPDYLK